MKKFIILLILSTFSTVLLAQIPDTLQKYEYCQIMGMHKILGAKWNIWIDYGQEEQGQRVRDEETGKVAKFNSMVAAMNDMATSGWELAEAYIFYTPQLTTYHWVLKRRIILNH